SKFTLNTKYILILIENITTVREVLVRDFLTEIKNFFTNFKIISLLILKNLIYIKTSMN
ncbi:hypothetical protein EMPG_11943, partial [Blastomyces silverae]